MKEEQEQVSRDVLLGEEPIRGDIRWGNDNLTENVSNLRPLDTWVA